MCLSRIEKFKPIRYGYVAIETMGHYYVAELKGNQRYKKGVWARSPRIRPISIGYGGKYVPGFHVWHSLSAARDWSGGGRIVRVEVRGILATGYQSGNKVTVARSRKIIKEVKNERRTP